MATTTMAGSASSSPPFPDDVPTAPLLRLSLHKLLKRDDAEVERFNRACEDLGFFYLDLKDDGDSLLRDANQLFDVAEAFCDLPLEEKEKYDFSSKKSYFGYKSQGAAVTDRNGNLDRNEFYNVSHRKMSPIYG
jgi:isopenicillin N synthase-like dioxygenase